MPVSPPEPTEPARDDALLAVLLELERHVAADGWDASARLFALVRTGELLAAEPGLAQSLGLRGPEAGAPADALTAVEQDEFVPSGDLVADRAGHGHGLARLRSASGDLLAADDLVPDLTAALAHTLAGEA